MAKVTAPLLSFGAEGSLANSLVYSRWRGVPYARRYVVPANPNTVAQQTTRNLFRWLNRYWVHAPALARAPWDTAAQGRPVLGVNLLSGLGIRNMRGDEDTDNFVASNGAHGGFAADSVDATAGVEEITVTATVPDPPPGWELEGVTFVLIQEQDPDEEFTGEVLAAEDTEAAFSNTFEDLVAAQEYRAFAWPRWTKPDGRTAYGPSISDTATPTAE